MRPLSGTTFYMKINVFQIFYICISVPLKRFQDGKPTQES